MVCMSLACRLYQLPIHQVVAKLNLVEVILIFFLTTSSFFNLNFLKIEKRLRT